MITVPTLPWLWEVGMESKELVPELTFLSQVVLMTSSPATTPPCLGHLRLELLLSSSLRKVTILDVLVGGWAQVVAWGCAQV